MSKVDILRFIKNVPKLFAPSIYDGQVFIAYTDESKNSFTVQGDNLSSGGSGVSNASVERLEQNLTALQTTVGALQETINEGSDSSSIIAVDDIIYGYYSTNGETPTIRPSNVIQLKGRPFLTDDNNSFKLAVDNYLNSLDLNDDVEVSSDIDVGNAYAGFRDGKIHTITNSGLSSSDLNNGDIILNKADNALYVYDAANHKFVKISGKRHYVVDYLVDYIGQTLPYSLNANEVTFFEINSSDFEDSELRSQGFSVSIDKKFYFANIQSSLNDDASIYEVWGEQYSHYRLQGIKAVHDLYDGDTIYNKADGCTYTFTVNDGVKSFVKTSPTTNSDGSLVIVDDIVSGYREYEYETGSSPSKDTRGRQYLTISGNIMLCILDYKGICVYLDDVYEGGKRYAAFKDGKFYTSVNGSELSSVPMNNGDVFFNKADNALYTYDAANHKFIKLSGKRHYVVDAVVDYVGISLPNTFTAEGTMYIETSGYENVVLHYMYRNSNQNNSLYNGSTYSPKQGFTFANINSMYSDDAEIYVVETSAIRAIHDLYDGDTIYNKEDGCTYTFTGSSFVKTAVSVVPPVADIVLSTLNAPSPSSKDDKLISYDSFESYFSVYITPANDNGEWDWSNQVKVEADEYYASLETRKVYQFKLENSQLRVCASDIPVGATFFNKADSSLYVNNGSTLVKIENTSE